MKTTAASLIIAICCSGWQAFSQELTPTLQLSDDFQQGQEQNSVPPRSSAAFSGGTINGLEINSLPATVTIDLGKIPKDITAKFTVEFKNYSSTDIQVDTVTSGCGCLVGRDFPKQVKQSEIGQFDLYVTSTKTGPYQKRLLVNAATLDRTINFLVKAECVDLLSVVPIVLELEEGKNCELHVAGNFLEQFPLSAASFQARDSGRLDVEIKDPGETQVTIKAALRETTFTGPVRFVETLDVTFANGKKSKFDVNCYVGGGLEIRPEIFEIADAKRILKRKIFVTGKPSLLSKVNAVDFALVETSSQKKVKATIIEVRRSTSLLLLEISCDDLEWLPKGTTMFEVVVGGDSLTRKLRVPVSFVVH